MNDDQDIGKLPEWVKAGVSFRTKPPHRRHIFHIRGIVDDQAVIREWWPSKQRWNYTCVEWAYFHVWQKDIEVCK